MEQRLQFIVTSIQEKLALGQTLEDAEVTLRKVFGKSEVEEAIKVLKENNPSVAGEALPTSLSDHQDYLGWYRGPKNSNDSHWGLLKTHLLNKENHWTQEMVSSLNLASEKVMEHLAPPKAQRPIVSKGLVLGYIQSGKTANFSAVIAKAIDEGYKLMVVLSGMHNNLRLQTQARLAEEIERPKPEACMTLTRVDEKGDFDKRQTVTANRALGSQEGFALVVLKKNTHVLRAFNSWVAMATKENIRSCPTLIIDDESDQASINTKKPEEDPTAINSKIRDLIKHFDKVSYVGYTATPFANVLIDGSITDDLYPRDFLVCLEKPPTYFGPEELFGRMGVNGTEERRPLPVIRTLPELEDGDEAEGIPDSLKIAIRTFIISGALRLFRGQRQEHITMLVHISHLVNEHSKYFQWIDEYIRELKIAFDSATALTTEFAKILSEDHKLTTQFVLGEWHAFDDQKFFGEVKSFIEKIEVILENSKSESRLSFDREEPLWGIIVGGNTLSRGLTIEGLTVSYFDRTTKQYDTLLQMGRWFGYRKGYVDLTRIFVTEEMKKNFYHLATVEQEIRDEIECMAINSERPIDVALRIRSFPNLKITAANKMRSAIRTSLTFSGSKIQFRTLDVKNAESTTQNSSEVESLIAQMKSPEIKKLDPTIEDWKSCHLFRRVPSEHIIQFLEKFKLNTANLRFDKALGIRYISDLNKYDELNDWSVCLMSSRSGNSYSLPTGEKCFLIKRSPLDSQINTSDTVTLKSLVPPADELIDLADIFNLPDMTNTEFKKYLLDNKLTDTRVRRELRPPTRGLLLIYPLETKVAEESGRLVSFSKVGPIYAISLVFPGSKNDIEFRNYIENQTI